MSFLHNTCILESSPISVHLSVQMLTSWQICCNVRPSCVGSSFSCVARSLPNIANRCFNCKECLDGFVDSGWISGVILCKADANLSSILTPDKSKFSCEQYIYKNIRIRCMVLNVTSSNFAQLKCLHSLARNVGCDETQTHMYSRITCRQTNWLSFP